MVVDRVAPEGITFLSMEQTTMTEDGERSKRRSELPGILSDPRSTHTGFTDSDTSTAPARRSDDEEAFALVGNEIRAAIVRTLGARAFDHGPDPPLSFSDLRTATDVDVVSSQFNYHLQKLVEQYVEKVDDGYRLRPEGKNLYRTIRAGTFTRRTSLDPIALQQPCYYCESDLALAYDDGMFTIQCHDCETLYDLILAPPSALRTTDDLRARVVQYNHHLRQAFAQGVCPTCVNDLGTELVDPAETAFSDVVERTIYVLQSCEYCGNHSYLSLGSMFLHHPAVIGFCYDRGVDVTTTPRWELEFAATDRHVSIRSSDPMELSLTVTAGPDALELVVDDQLAILDHRVVADHASG